MNFTDVSFMVFLAVTLLVYRFVPLKIRWFYLLVVGSIFYCSLDVRFFYALLVMMALTYVGCHLLASATRLRLATLWTFVIAVLGWLFVVKWPSTAAIELFGPPHSFFPGAKSETLMNLTVPIGMSFHALQCVSALVDTYRAPAKWNPHPGYFALYLCYLPQILAGPIERIPHMYPQFERPQVRSSEEVMKGLELFVLGLFKKLVVADRFAVILTAYTAGLANNQDPLVSLLLIFSWATYLFADLSGYTDMARGMSYWFGIELKKNFDAPYAATTNTEYWTRWHVTLHHFFRDYVYAPMKKSNVPIPLCVLAVFILSGIWHGLGFNFVVMGLVCFAIFMFESVTMKRFPGYRHAWGGTIRNYAFCSFILIFFFMKTPADAANLAQSLTEPIDTSKSLALLKEMGWQAKDLVIFLVASVVGFNVFNRPEPRVPAPMPVRWFRIVALVVMILILRYPKTSLHTYFQF